MEKELDKEKSEKFLLEIQIEKLLKNSNSLESTIYHDESCQRDKEKRSREMKKQIIH